MSWGDRLFPIVDPGIRGGLRAKDLQLGIVSPFLSGSVNELAGSIDAKLSVTLDKGIPRLEGQATLSRGVIQIPSIGQRFDSTQVLATVHDGTFSVDNVQARGLTGRVTGSAKIKLDGLSLTSGDMHLAVARNEQIPITVEGQAMGDAWGRVDVKVNRLEGKNTTNIWVDVLELHFDLPDVDPRSLQTLKGINKAVENVTKLDVSARLDTSTGTARPELDVQLTPRVTARMTRAIGEPAVGQSPDRTFLTLELRLLRSWSLSAVVGDHGGPGLDILWRRRY